MIIEYPYMNCYCDKCQNCGFIEDEPRCRVIRLEMSDAMCMQVKECSKFKEKRNLNINRIEIINKINDLIKMSADYFYPDYITGTCNISMDESLMELKRLVDDGILELKFEIQTDGKVVKTINDFREYYGKEITYKRKTFVVNFDNVFPCYYISKEYKKYCLKN